MAYKCIVRGRYMGGTAEKLWRFCPADSEAIALTSDFDGTFSV